MSVKQKNEIELVSKEAFQAIGLKWEGTFAGARAGEIRIVHNEMHNRLREIPYLIHPQTLLGLSYHAMPDGKGFTHYAVVEVEKIDVIPTGMVKVSVPTLTYIKSEHQKGQSIELSYQNIYESIKKQELKENNVDDLTHFEKYPMSQDPYDNDPAFTIMIPVQQNS